MAASDENRDPNTKVSADEVASRHLEYEVQAYGFSFKAFSDSLYNMLGDYIRDVSVEFQNRMITKDTTDKERVQLTSQMQKFKARMDTIIGLMCDKAEGFLVTSFSIPDHAVLPEDAVQMTNVTQRERDLQKCRIDRLELLLAKRAYEKRMLELAITDLKDILRKNP